MALNKSVLKPFLAQEREESYAYSLAEFLAEHIAVGLVMTALTLVIIFVLSMAR